MNHDERHQQELEEQQWYLEGPGSDVWKQHQRYLAELKEMEAESVELHKRIWRGRDI